MVCGSQISGEKQNYSLHEVCLEEVKRVEVEEVDQNFFKDLINTMRFAEILDLKKWGLFEKNAWSF